MQQPVAPGTRRALPVIRRNRRMPSPQEHTFTFVAVALRRLLAPVASGADRWRRTSLRGFPQPSPGDRAQKLERPGEGVAAVSGRRNEGLSAQDRYPPKPGDTWSERQGGYLRDVVGQLGHPVEQ